MRDAVSMTLHAASHINSAFVTGTMKEVLAYISTSGGMCGAHNTRLIIEKVVNWLQ